MAEIKHDISISASQEIIHQALTTAEGLKSWFTSEVEGSGKVGTDWKLSFVNEPFFSWRILTSDANSIVWECLQGPGNAPGTEVEFALKSTGRNQTLLTIIHRGWTADDPKFDRCVSIWRNLMSHLQRYCEVNIAEPAYQ